MRRAPRRKLRHSSPTRDTTRNSRVTPIDCPRPLMPTAFVTNLAEVHARLRDNLRLTQERTQQSADAIRTPAPTFNIGDKAFVHAEFIRSTRPSRKLADKYLGPFEIIGAAGPASFILRFPDGMCRIHPICNIGFASGPTSAGPADVSCKMDGLRWNARRNYLGTH